MLRPRLPDYEIAAWRARPFPERLRMVCQSWARDGYGTPAAVYVGYGAKIVAYMAVWLLLCLRLPGWDLANIDQWWFEREAFTKFIAWTMLFEGLGLGCGSGPLTARYVPPMGGALYFLRPGGMKLPLFPGMPAFGSHRRGALDVLGYAALLGALVRICLVEQASTWDLAAVPALLALLSLTDRTLFLVFRSEHYLSATLALLLAGDWITANRTIWLAIWFWAAASKLTPHFPAVMCVMTSNAPFTRGTPLRRWVYRDPPNDLRPSTFAVVLAHFGTAAEFLIPLGLLWSDGSPATTALLILATGFHLFILANVPMAVPLEWNIAMIYGAWVLFGAHGHVAWDLSANAAWWPWFLGLHVAVPIVGFLAPHRVSFLLSMRYYAGNWAYNVWLLRDSARDKMDKHLLMLSPRVEEQLGRFYDEDTVTALLSKVPAFRAMHLHGRALQQLLPIAVDDIEERTWLDGEVIAGRVLGWNFGDGHLHRQPLLDAMHEECGFEPGEVRCIFVESQPFFGDSLAWQVVDAAEGVLASGRIPVQTLQALQPWPHPGWPASVDQTGRMDKTAP